MRNKTLGMLVFAIVFALILVGCASNKTPLLKGAYQSEHVNGYIVQMTFQPEDHSFVEYIDNREVDKGTYEELEDGLYKINGELQEFAFPNRTRLQKYTVDNPNLTAIDIS
nr:hypothetical protein [Fredinandcohnia onubensis]